MVTPAPERILLFIPTYNCCAQIPRVLAQLTPPIAGLLSEVIIVDNGSRDGTREAVIEALSDLSSVSAKVMLNDRNYGLGGSHKVAFNYAISHGFDYCIVLHGDDQGSIADLVPLIEEGEHRNHDCLLGARFMRGSKLEGYSPLRTFGNRFFNTAFSLLSGRRLWDLGSGLNIYRVSSLKNHSYRRHPNDLTFNYHMILHSVSRGDSLLFFPILWREADQVSNVKLFRQSRTLINILLEFAFFRRRFLDANYAPSEEMYTSTIIHSKEDITV